MKNIFKIISSFTLVAILVLMTSSMTVSSANNLVDENLSALMQQTEFDNTDAAVHIFCRSTLLANCYWKRGCTCTWSAHGSYACSASGYSGGDNPN